MSTRVRLHQSPRLAIAIAVTCASCKVGSLVDSGTSPQSSSAPHFVFATQPSSTTAGSDITPAVQVQLVDSTGDVVTQFSGPVTISLAHDGSVLNDASLQGTTTVTATGGMASFSNLHIDKTGLGYTLGVGTPAGASPAVSQPFDVVPL